MSTFSVSPSRLFHCLGLAALVAALPAPSRAEVSIGASPASLEMTLDRGKTTAQPVLLFNQGKKPVTVAAYAWDWWHEPGNARKFAPPGSLPHSAAKWISFIPEKVTVNPGKGANVTVVVNTPKEASAGNYAVAWFEAIPEANPNSKELRVGARLGVLVMTEVRGHTKPGVIIQELAISPPTASQPLKADVKIANSGDVHLFPKGTLVIMDRKRRLVGHVGFEKQRMLPGEERSVTVKYGGDLK
ncbi:MAG: hypothetical protein JXP73_19115, partial [Deltaproteobacteria bacterium]|nr:hypothetical protein [Deltaproteobacteria bacterium]